MPGKSAIETEEMNDFVVTGVKALTKEQAQTEMKDRTETDNFTLPDCLPAIPYDVAKETEGLLIKDFGKCKELNFRKFRSYRRQRREY